MTCRPPPSLDLSLSSRRTVATEDLHGTPESRVSRSLEPHSEVLYAERPDTVQATSSADVLHFMFTDDVAYGWGGDDNFRGRMGNDVLFGGAGNDTFDTGAGADIVIGGAGDDDIYINLDCEIDADDVVDGGPGTDTVYSHKTQTQLASAGVLLVSIENFVIINEDESDGTIDCVGFPYTYGALKHTDLTLSWDQLPTETSIYTTDTGILTLDVVNETDKPRTFTLRYIITIGGHSVELEETSTTLSAQADTSFTLDLSDLIPANIDPGNINSAYFFLPSSVPLIASAQIVDNGETVEHAFAPVLWGHAHDEDTLKIYREGAMRASYFNGHLSAWRGGASGANPYSVSSEAWGEIP